MKMPDWLKDALKGMIPDLLAEFLGVQSIKNLLNKARGKADEGATNSTEQNEKEPEIKHGGLFNLSDEKEFFSLMGKVGTYGDDKDKSKEYVDKISKLLNSFPNEWQRRRFRAAVGLLNCDCEIKTTHKTNPKTYENGKIKTENATSEEKVVTKNIGVQFLVSLAQHDRAEMMKICKASGILHSDFEAIKKAWEKLTTWAENQGPELITSINVITAQIKASANYTEPKPQKPYPGFLKAFLGLN